MALLLDNVASLCTHTLAQSVLIGAQPPMCTEDVTQMRPGTCPQGLTFWGPTQTQTDIRAVGEWVCLQPCKGHPFSVTEHREDGWGQGGAGREEIDESWELQG